MTLGHTAGRVHLGLGKHNRDDSCLTLCRTAAAVVSPHNSTLCYRPGLSFLGAGGMKLLSLGFLQLCSEQPREDAAVGAFHHRVATKQLPLTLAKLQ